MRPLISDLGAVHGHSFDPVPSYLYAFYQYTIYICVAQIKEKVAKIFSRATFSQYVKCGD